MMKVAKFESYVRNCGDFADRKDFYLFGTIVAKQRIEALCKTEGFIDRVCRSRKGELMEIGLEGMKLSYVYDEKLADSMLAMHFIGCMPKFFTPELIYFLIGAVLQEYVIVIHSEHRQYCYKAIALVLGLIQPLKWPYPIIPLIIDSSMAGLLESPVPLICGIEEPSSDFVSRWSSHSKTHNHIIHIQLETSRIYGQPRLSFRKSVISHQPDGFTDHCQALHDHIWQAKDTHATHTLTHKYQSAIRSTYMPHIHIHTLMHDDSADYRITRDAMISKAKAMADVVQIIAHTQMMHVYMDKVKADMLNL